MWRIQDSQDDNLKFFWDDTTTPWVVYYWECLLTDIYKQGCKIFIIQWKELKNPYISWEIQSWFLHKWSERDQLEYR